MTGIPFAYSFFSTLAPGSTIAPHFGASNLKLRCHLPLYCEHTTRLKACLHLNKNARCVFAAPQDNPTECALRVAGVAQPWKPGKLMMFDDSYGAFVVCRISQVPTGLALHPAPTVTAEHEAYYSTSPKEAAAHASARVVLLFDVWHPDLSQGEISAITGLLGEIAAREPDASGAKRA